MFKTRNLLALDFRREGVQLWYAYMPLARKDILAASLALNLTALALPLVVLQVYDRIIPHQSFHTLAFLIIGLCGALALDAVLRISRSYIAGWSGAKFEHVAGMKAVERILNADLIEIEKTPAGKHLDRLSSIDPVRDFYASQASLTLVDLPFALLFLALLGVIAGSLVLVPTLLILIFGVVALWVGQRLRGALEQRSTLDDRRYNFIIEVLSGIRTVKGLAMEKLMQRRYERLLENCATTGHDVGYWSSIAQGVGSGFAQLTMIVVASIGCLYVIDGRISVGALAACTLLAGRTVQPVLRALGIWTRFQSIRIATDRLNAVEDMQLEAPVDVESAPEIRSVSLQDATIQFPDDERPLFEKVSLVAKRGEMIAIKGRNGSGKSTLLWSLMSGVELQSGKLLYNGENAQKFELKELRAQMAYLPQHAVVFNASALDNLTGFGGVELQEEALRLASLLGLDHVFARMPDGYESRLGNTSVNAIAAGVTQRIAIVRALVRRPRVILFDEANSALDSQADELVKQLLLACKEDAMVVMVTHRPSLLREADRVYEIDNGCIKESASVVDAARFKGVAS